MRLSPNKNEVRQPTLARLRARWRSTEAENREAVEVRRQWLAIIGVDQAEIDDICEPLVDLDLAEELEELSAAIRMSK